MKPKHIALLIVSIGWLNLHGFTSSERALAGRCLFGGFGRFGWLLLLLLPHGNDVDVDLTLAFLLLVGLAGRGGEGEGEGEGGRAHYLSLRLGQEALLRRVGVLVGEERREKGEGAVAGRAAELGAGL